MNNDYNKNSYDNFFMKFNNLTLNTINNNNLDLIKNNINSLSSPDRVHTPNKMVMYLLVWDLSKELKGLISVNFRILIKKI